MTVQDGRKQYGQTHRTSRIRDEEEKPLREHTTPVQQGRDLFTNHGRTPAYDA